jgi:hypothetical protein
MDALKVERAPICTKVRNAPSLRLVADVVVGRPVEINAKEVKVVKTYNGTHIVSIHFSLRCLVNSLLSTCASPPEFAEGSGGCLSASPVIFIRR